MVSTEASRALILAECAARPTLKWRAARAGDIPLWLADMDFPIAPAICDVIIRHATTSSLTYGGDVEAAEAALAKWIQRQHGWCIPQGRVLWTTSVTQGAAIAIHALTNPADRVVLCTPAYPPLYRAVQEAGKQLIPWPLIRRGTQYLFDLTSLERILDAHHPAMLIVNSPHNPTGRVFTAAELNDVAAVIAGRRVSVISDEIFADIVYDNARHTPFAAAVGGELAARTVTLYSASKAFNIAGLKCAALICGDPQVRKRIESVSACLIGAPGVMGVEASLAAWTKGESWLADTLAKLAANRRLLETRLHARLPALRWSVPEGTFVAWFDARDLRAGQDPRDFLLQHAHVDVAAGEIFGPEGAGFIRIAFATPPEILEAAIDAIVNSLTNSAPA